MSADPLSQPSFSTRRKWAIGLNVVLIVLVLLSVVVMVNYLSHGYFARHHLSTRTDVQLSPRTLALVRSLTNQVRIILYYDKEDRLYSTIADLLKEYQRNNTHLLVQTVDYVRDTGLADKIKADYKQYLGGDKDVVLFECEGRVRKVPGKLLASYAAEPNPDDKEGRLLIRPVAFRGEMMFTAVLLAVTNPKPLEACFLTGHGEGRWDDPDEQNGFQKLAAVIQQSYVQVDALSLIGTTTVPTNCDLLIIAGPTDALPDVELERIDQYLNRGGRLLALFNFQPIRQGRPTGLEGLLAKWGVNVTSQLISDPENSLSKNDVDVVVSDFGTHPIVYPLSKSRLHMILPRAIGALKPHNQSTDNLRVDELVRSGPNSVVRGDDSSRKQARSLAVAVERGAIPGVDVRDTTRIVAVGDSIFLANHQIDSAGNRDFADYAINWLLDRTQMLGGLGPRPLDEYRLIMTSSQLQQAQWLLLVGMPGALLALGSLVWLRRRK
jgi:LPXTG-motif cell wall-anchored protein